MIKDKSDKSVSFSTEICRNVGLMIRAKASVAGMKPYVNGRHSAELIRNHKKIIKLDSNESTIGPSPKVMSEILNYLQNGPLNWYPDVESTDLRARLVNYTGLPADHILTFNGSDHALETLARTFLSLGDEVLYPHPSYDHFRVYAESCDAKLVPFLAQTDAELVAAIAQLRTEQTKILYLVNPNNPTGQLTAQKTIRELAATYPTLLIVVDEAYFEFCGETSAGLVLEFANILVTRSFSKAFGLASLRCGYLLAAPQVAEQIERIRVGKNINALAQVAATAALDDLESMERYVEDVHNAKAWLLERFLNYGLEAKDTPANFLLFKAENPARVMQFLELHNIYIRDRSQLPGLEGFLRISIGDQLIMKRFWKIFLQIPLEHLLPAQRLGLNFQEPFYQNPATTPRHKERERL